MNVSEKATTSTRARIFEFGEFRMDVGRRHLLRPDGTPVPLTPRLYETLLFLVEHSDTVLDKERLMEAVWPDSIVEENNLTQSISKLRQIFGERPGAHQFIVTVPGRGYRFVAEVKVAQASSLQEGGEQAGSLRYREPMEPARPRAEVSTKTPSLPIERPPARAAFAGPWRAKGRAGSIAAALAILLLGAAALFWWRSPTLPPAALPAPLAVSEKSIAVLPFENLSDDKQNSYFAAGVQDEILTNLAKIADLKVISRTSANLYKIGNPRNSREIGQQLGVAHLLEGSVQHAGNRVRLNMQLIDARTDAHIWAQTYDRDVADVFAIQSEIARAIADQLKAKISRGEQAALAQAPTTDPIASALYVEARELEFNEPGSQRLLEAVRRLDQAVAREPQFMLAYCLLGRLHISLFHYGHDHTPARRELANVAIQNAVRLQPEAGEPHLASARYAYYGFRDYDRARAELDLARRTLPNDAEIYYLTALLDRRQGRWTEAIRNAERAVELDPRNPQYLSVASGIYGNLRRYSDSRRLAERTLEIPPRRQVARLQRAGLPATERADLRPLRAVLSAILAEEPGAAEKIAEDLFYCALAERDSVAVARALAAMRSKRLEGGVFDYPHEWFAGLAARTFNDPAAASASFSAARTIVEKFAHAQPEDAHVWSLLGRIDAALGRKEDAVREGRRACELVPLSKDALEGAGFITDLAVVYAWIGEKELALEQLAISAQISAGVTYGGLKLESQWDSLRGDPRFEKIVAGLAPKEIAP